MIFCHASSESLLSARLRPPASIGFVGSRSSKQKTHSGCDDHVSFPPRGLRRTLVGSSQREPVSIRIVARPLIMSTAGLVSVPLVVHNVHTFRGSPVERPCPLSHLVRQDRGAGPPGSHARCGDTALLPPSTSIRRNSTHRDPFSRRLSPSPGWLSCSW